MNQRRTARIIRALLLAGCCGAFALPAIAQTAPDNTKTNKQDRAKGAVTADQQKQNAADLEVVKKIRQSIIKDKSLSTYAHNVKVVVIDGEVTLRGPVRSDEEKASVAAKAVEIAGVDHVTNEITIAPTKAKR